MKMHDLLAAAESSGTLAAEDSARITRHLAEPPEAGAMPWYLHVLVTAGAWFSAAFFLGFLFSALESTLLHEYSAQIVAGLILIGVAAGGWRITRSPFMHQVCLAVSVAGHVLTLIGVEGAGHHFGVVVFCAAALAAALYPLYADGLHRFLSCGSALALFDLWMREKVARYRWQGGPDFADLFSRSALFHGSVILHCALLAFLFLRPAAPRSLRPLAYAATLSLLVLVVCDVAPVLSRLYLPLWPGQVIFTLCLLGLIVWAFPHASRRALALCLGVAVLSGAVADPAILIALGLLLLGYGLQDRALLTLGSLSLPLAIGFYYYSLQLTLAQKSLLLLASGAVLLSARAWLVRLHPPDSAA